MTMNIFNYVDDDLGLRIIALMRYATAPRLAWLSFISCCFVAVFITNMSKKHEDRKITSCNNWFD